MSGRYNVCIFSDDQVNFRAHNFRPVISAELVFSFILQKLDALKIQIELSCEL